jgi:hypothetical protein
VHSNESCLHQTDISQQPQFSRNPLA